MLHIVIVNWNGSEDTVDCVKSILKDDPIDVNVIVVDNGSEEKQTNFLRSELYWLNKLHIVETGENLGFSGGNNAGIWYILGIGSLCDEDFVLFLNNDTTVENWFHVPLLEAFKKNKKLGIAQPLILYEHNKNLVNSFGQVYSKNWLAFSPFREKDRNVTKDMENTTPLSLVSWCAFCTRAEIINEVMENSQGNQFWDEDFFLYGEDVEISLRIRSLWYGAAWVTDSVIYHKEGASTKKLSKVALFHSYKNITQTYLVSFDMRELAKLGPYLFVMELISMPYTLLNGNFLTWLKAKIWVLKNWSMIMKKRDSNLRNKRKSLISEFTNKWVTEKA